MILENNKMMQHLDHKMKVIVKDGRAFVGYFKAFDQHMNIILADCEDPGPAKPKYYNKKVQVDEKKRILSLVLLRGDNVISISVEGPPQQREYGVQTPRAGTGQHYGVSRGVPPVGVGSIPHNQLMPVGSQGPVRGVRGSGTGGVMQQCGAPGGKPPRSSG